jgi:hypothetical protein
MVDFGAEVSFAKAEERMREHHGLRVRAEEVRQETYQHARTMGQLEPAPRAPSAVVVAQIDGSMIPILQKAAPGADKRRARQVGWQDSKPAWLAINIRPRRFLELPWAACKSPACSGGIRLSARA